MKGECVTTLETMGHCGVTFGYCWGNVDNETICGFAEKNAKPPFFMAFCESKKGSD